MAQSLRLVTKIIDSEDKNRPIKCYVRESVNNLTKNRSQTACVDLSVFVDPILAAILWKLLSQSEKFCMNFTIWLYKQWKFEDKNVGKEYFSK